MAAGDGGGAGGVGGGAGVRGGGGRGEDFDVVREGTVVVYGGGEVIGYAPLVVDDEFDVVRAGLEGDSDGECRVIVRTGGDKKARSRSARTQRAANRTRSAG